MAEKTTAFTGPVVVGLNDKKGEIRLTDGKNVNEAKYLAIAAPDNITSDTTLTFPNGAGTAGQILSTDGNGGLSWVNDSAGNPDGTNGQVQFNDNGTFGAIPDGTSGQVLKSNGAGVAPSFQTDATNSPGGSNTEMQFNDNGTFGAVSNGTAGQILTSNGAGSTPTFQAAPAGIDTSGFAWLNTGDSVFLESTGQNNPTNYSNSIRINSGSIFLDGNHPNGVNNIALGNAAGSSLGAATLRNTLIGNQAGQDLNSGDDNTLVGDIAGENITSGIQNTAIGKSALRSATGAAGNTALGYNALQNCNSNLNTGIGLQALNQLTGGIRNTALGNSSGQAFDGNDSTFLGLSAGSSLSGGSNNTIIGYGAQASAATVSNEITLGDTNVTSLRIPGLQSGASANDVLTFNGTDITLAAAGGGGGGGTSWQSVITTNTTAATGQGFFVNTSGGAVTLTLPASPTQGDEVSFVDYAGTAATNNITIGRNGENIQGSASDLIINTNRASNTLVYSDATQGWLLTNI